MTNHMKSNLTGNQFGIYWTRLNVNKALSSSNGNVCITLSTQNIDFKKMEKWNGQCHFCKNEIESLIRLFYRCHKIKHVLDEVKHIFNIIFEKNIVLVEENCYPHPSRMWRMRVILRIEPEAQE